MKKSLLKFDTKAVVTVGIGASLYGVLGFFGFLIGPNTSLKPAVALLTIFGALFGPLVGFFMGFFGHCITDMLAGWGIWWGWVLSSAIMGGFMGLISLCKNFNVKYGLGNKKHIIFMILNGVLGIVLAFTFAGGFDVLIMDEPLKKIIVQCIGAIISNLIVFFFLGIPLVMGFLKRNKKNSNLTLDK